MAKKNIVNDHPQVTEKLSKDEEYLRIRIFLNAILDHKSPYVAIDLAGLKTSYSPYMLLERTECRQLLATMMRERVELVHAPRAIGHMANIMENLAASDKARIDCAKHMLNLSGYQPPKVIPAAKPEYGTPSEMTASEIQAQIDKLESELNQKARSAKVVNPPVAEIDIFS